MPSARRARWGRARSIRKQLVDLVRSQAKRLVLFDMEETAERNQSVISSFCSGLCAAAGCCRSASRLSKTRSPERDRRQSKSGRGSRTPVGWPSVAIADSREGYTQVAAGGTGTGAHAEFATSARSSQTSALRRATGCAGRRAPAIDYQDPAYAALFLDRVERIVALDSRLWADASSYALLEATARSLALWMTFEDTIRVADLKTRASRFVRVAR